MVSYRSKSKTAASYWAVALSALTTRLRNCVMWLKRPVSVTVPSPKVIYVYEEGGRLGGGWGVPLGK